MSGRIVEVADAGRHLSLSRGHLVVKAEGGELGRVPLEDVAALVANGHGLTYSNNLLLALGLQAALRSARASRAAASTCWRARCARAIRGTWRPRRRGVIGRC